MALVYAKALGCPQINCLTGIAPPDVAAEVPDATMIESLAYAAPRIPLRRLGTGL